ncbi:MAG: type II toxin-antitoxin system VapC family toxin [Acidobacteriota bacterium]|nr:MAG: type II toxin-antitoxin system VapC family toxin [Acidobacteriota bacterium]
MTEAKRIVIDANVGVLTVLDYPLSDAVAKRWHDWIEDAIEVYAPGLWLNEVTSVIHKEQKLGAISKEEAVAALDTVLELDVECVTETPRLCRAAFKWATLLNQTAAYDGFYLALAEDLVSSLWTGDRRLVRRAHQIDVPWVRFIGDA